MSDAMDVDRLAEDWTRRGLSRRDLFRLLAAGVSAPVAASLMARGEPAVAAALQATPAPKGGQVSVLWKQPVTLNPLFSTSGSEQQVERLIFGALVKMSDKLVPTPDLATKVDVSPDAKVYTFHLHDKITFSDGTPLTSKDVAFTFERAIDKRTASIWRGRLLGIAGAQEYGDQKAASISGLATPDDHTVQVTLAAPNSAFLANLCNFSGFGILPAHVLQNVPPDQLQKHSFSLAPNVSAGAFKFNQFQTNQYLQVDRNATYFGEAAPLDSIFMRILTVDVGLAQLQTGEIDLLSVPPSELERVQKLANVKVDSVPSPSMDFLALNLTRPYLQNKDLHKAMIHAIDREGILKQVFRGQGEVVNSPIFGPAWMGVPEGLENYTYDVDKAKALLKQSGWDTSRKLQLMHLPGTKEKDAAIAIMQEELTQIGIKAEIFQVDVAELNTRYVETGDFDVFYNSGGVFRADPSISGSYFQTQTFTPNGGNASHYSNPQIDQLYAQGVATGDPAERKKTYTQIAKILNDELPWIFLWSPNSLYGYRDRLHGFAAPSYTDNKLWNAETWSVTK